MVKGSKWDSISQFHVQAWVSQFVCMDDRARHSNEWDRSSKIGTWCIRSWLCLLFETATSSRHHHQQWQCWRICNRWCDQNQLFEVTSKANECIIHSSIYIGLNMARKCEERIFGPIAQIHGHTYRILIQLRRHYWTLHSKWRPHQHWVGFTW